MKKNMILTLIALAFGSLSTINAAAGAAAEALPSIKIYDYAGHQREWVSAHHLSAASMRILWATFATEFPDRISHMSIGIGAHEIAKPFSAQELEALITRHGFDDETINYVYIFIKNEWDEDAIPRAKAAFEDAAFPHPMEDIVVIDDSDSDMEDEA